MTKHVLVDNGKLTALQWALEAKQHIQVAQQCQQEVKEGSVCEWMLIYFVLVVLCMSNYDVM